MVCRGRGSELNKISHLYLQDDEVFRILRAHQEGEELNADDEYRLVILQRTIWRSYESAYRWYVNGVLGPSEWTRFERNNCVQRAELSSGLWDSVKPVLSDEFAAYVDSYCAGYMRE